MSRTLPIKTDTPKLRPRRSFTQSQRRPRFCFFFFSILPTARPLSSGVTDPRRGGNGLQSSLNSPNLQGRAAQRSVKSPARPYFSHEFPLAPSSDCISAAHTAGLEFQLFSLLQTELEGHRARTLPGEVRAPAAAPHPRGLCGDLGLLGGGLSAQAQGSGLASSSFSSHASWSVLNTFETKQNKLIFFSVSQWHLYNFPRAAFPSLPNLSSFQRFL